MNGERRSNKYSRLVIAILGLLIFWYKIQVKGVDIMKILCLYAHIILVTNITKVLTLDFSLLPFQSLLVHSLLHSN